MYLNEAGLTRRPESVGADRSGPNVKSIQNSKGKRLPGYLEQWEVNALLASAPNPQAALLFMVQWRAGLRVSEALALRWADIGRDAIRVRGKGGKDRIVDLHPELAGAFHSAKMFGEKRPKVFDVTRGTAWKWVQVANRRAVASGALEPGRAKIGTHTFRHSFARHILASGEYKINEVQRLLGHADLQTTLIYLELVPTGNMENVP